MFDLTTLKLADEYFTERRCSAYTLLRWKARSYKCDFNIRQCFHKYSFIKMSRQLQGRKKWGQVCLGQDSVKYPAVKDILLLRVLKWAETGRANGLKDRNVGSFIQVYKKYTKVVLFPCLKRLSNHPRESPLQLSPLRPPAAVRACEDLYERARVAVLMPEQSLWPWVTSCNRMLRY